jgi:tRNA-dihydrouridine synthase 3
MDSNVTLKTARDEVNDFASGDQGSSNGGEPASKRVKLANASQLSQDEPQNTPRPRVKGVAPIKEEFVTLFP